MRLEVAHDHARPLRRGRPEDVSGAVLEMPVHSLDIRTLVRGRAGDADRLAGSFRFRASQLPGPSMYSGTPKSCGQG